MALKWRAFPAARRSSIRKRGQGHKQAALTFEAASAIRATLGSRVLARSEGLLRAGLAARDGALEATSAIRATLRTRVLARSEGLLRAGLAACDGLEAHEAAVLAADCGGGVPLLIRLAAAGPAASDIWRASGLNMW